MEIILEKQECISNKMKYALINPRIDGNFFKWDGFNFYTDYGDQIDQDGKKYFFVPHGEIDLTKHLVLHKTIIVIAIAGEDIECLEILEGAEVETRRIENPNGDFIIVANIPPEPEENITVVYKEVL